MKDVEIRNVKGTFDYLPKEQKIRNYVTDTLKEVFENYGYLPAVTPTLCYYDVLASKYGGGAEILKEVYQLQDQGKRNLALRYDLTVPFAKLLTLSKGLNLPFKRYEIGKVFRDGPVKVGRNREFVQCDVDVVGVEDVLIDAELISLYVTAFKKLNLDITVDYNNRKLMTGLLEECGIKIEQMTDVITVIDKFKKLTKEEIKKEFLNCDLEENQINQIYTYFQMGFDGIKQNFSNTTNLNIQQGLEELQEVKEYLEYLNITTNVKIDLTLARGLNIYTGTVFEVFTKNGNFTSAIGGGGRYDKIITNFINDGNNYPAVGCSFGLDAICEVLKQKEEFKLQNNVDLLIVPLNAKKESLKLANELRKQSVRVELQYNERKLNKILNSADKEHIPYVIILGEDEVKQNKIVLKDMINKTSNEFSLTDYEKIITAIKI